MTDKVKRSELKGYITTEQASEILGITRRRVQQLCRAGAIPAVWVSQRWLMRPWAVDAYRRQRE